MKCIVNGNKKLRSHNTSYYTIEVVIKSGWTGIILNECPCVLILMIWKVKVRYDWWWFNK